ncbi:VWA domain-containing protein [Posidoniimonas corsicana]|nr:VWA domain-containing protein [Posidoniimonas corsicana]
MNLLTRHSLVIALAAALLPAAAQAGQVGPVGVYQHESGDTYFSMSLSADFGAEPAQAGRNIAVLFDTSASQTGMYRTTALSALKAMLGKLRAEDRVRLYAVDLEARPMGDRFSPAGSAALGAAVEKLKHETPLGSTDLNKALKAAAHDLEESNASNRVVVYIGDGVSAANLLRGPSFAGLISELRDGRVSVNSYAIGPQRDAELLAAIANGTGGNLYVDGAMSLADEASGVTLERANEENARRGAQVGRTLASWAQAEVVWPKSVAVSDSISELYPAELPPMRSDRDSIVVGRLKPDAKQIQISASLGHADRPQPSAWRHAVPEASEANAYLSQLVGQAESDQGVSLPTLGTAGLNEVARTLNAGVEQLTNLAEKAVATGDSKSANQIAEAVLRRDPGNLRAKTVKRVVARKTGESDEPTDNRADLNMVRVAQVEVVDAPALGDPVVVYDSAEPYYDPSGLPPADVVRDDEFLTAVEKQNRIMAEQLRKEVQVAISEARDIMSRSPQDAIQSLKLMAQSIQNAPELLADVRASLSDRLEMALRQASRAASIKDELDRQSEEAIAAARERMQLLDSMEQNREREKQLMDRFNALMDEEQYAQAEEVAEIVRTIDPEGVTPVAADQWAAFSRYHYQNQQLRALRAKAWIETLAQVEQSAIPFPDNPPIVYPDAEFWRQITESRKKYESVGITGKSDSEERIAEALASPLTSAGLDFLDTPLEEVVDFLRTEYEIEIQLDETALDDLGIGTDEPVTVNLRNISLRSALRLMFKQLELTYVIADEVLLITTEEEAETRLTVRVYNVGDLVIDKTPIPALGGAGGGGGGFGGGGGGLGGGGGGFGGGGGGLGGGGGGFGGGGGAFSVPEDLVLTKRAVPTNASAPAVVAEPVRKAKRAAKPSPIKIDDSIPADQFWADYFEAGEVDPAAVRETSRQLMKRGDHAGVVALIQNALRHGQPQPWMYEALGIAMQVAGNSPHDVERAIMSAVDFSSSADELILISHYLTKLELDSRAIQVLQQAVKLDPTLKEAYLLGMKSAERTGDLDGLRWATVGILSRAWPSDQQGIEDEARRLAAATLRQLEVDGRISEHDAYNDDLVAAMQRDCVIRVTWTGDADVDLLVEEPDGSVCSSSNPRTPGGGVMLGDTFATSDGPGQKGFSETYLCPRGFNGAYQAVVRRVWGDVTAGVVTVDVYTNYGAPNEKHQRGQVELGKGDSAVKFELADGRRAERVDEQQLVNAINRQEAVGRAVLAQQLGSMSDPGVTALRPDDLQRIRRRQLAGGGGGAVGFQPQITVLPDGTQLTVNAVATADRRYVIVRPAPSITSISDVSTFTFAGASQDADDGNDDGDDDGDAAALLLGRRGVNVGGDDDAGGNN